MRRILTLSFMLVVLATARFSLAQVATGTPPFGSFGGGPVDTINLSNLNSHVEIPVVNKAGRGLPFSYIFSYDSSVWHPVGSWQHDPNWGWRGQVEIASGYVSYRVVQTDCNIGTSTDPFYYYYNKYTFTGYHDMNGTGHSFTKYVYDDDTCSSYKPYPTLPYSATVTLGDGSGLTIYVAASPSATVYPKSGGSIEPPLQNTSAAAATTTDFNGNQVTTTDGVNFKDTLGTTVLSITGNAQSGSVTYTFQTTTGINVVTVTYSLFTVQTSFGCSNIAETTVGGVYLPVSVSRSDGISQNTYQFTYEQTPGKPSTYTTARLTTITLPTGGTIEYSYNNGGLASGIASEGIVCANGSTAGITRTLSPASGVNEGSGTYSRGGSSPAWTTTVTDPAGNDTYLQFQDIYETQRDMYSGLKSGGNILQTIYTCYAGAAYPCNATSIAMPPTRRTVTTAANGYYKQIDTTFDPYTNPLVTKEYDFGSGSPGGLLRETDITYATISGGIVDRPSDIVVKDGSGNKASETKYSYDGSALTATSGSPGPITLTTLLR